MSAAGASVIQQIRRVQVARERRRRYVLPRLLIFSGPGAHCLWGPSLAFRFVFGKAKPPKGAAVYREPRAEPRLPFHVRYPPRADGRVWRRGLGYRTPEEHAAISWGKRMVRVREQMGVQDEAVLAGVRASLVDGETTSGRAYAEYVKQALPWPLKHMTTRSFAVYLDRLVREGRIEGVVASAGRAGRTRIIRLPPDASESTVSD